MKGKMKRVMALALVAVLLLALVASALMPFIPPKGKAKPCSHCGYRVSFWR